MTSETNDLELGDDLHITQDFATGLGRRRLGSAGRSPGTVSTPWCFPSTPRTPNGKSTIAASRSFGSSAWPTAEQVFHWDRGADVPAADPLAAAIVDFLCAGLADLAYAE